MQQCKRATTSSEFVLWQAFFEEQLQERRREDFYWANIALEIRRSWVKDPGKYKLDDFLLSFQKGESAAPPTQDDIPQTDQEKLKQQIATSKGFWATVTGLVRQPPPQK